MVRVGSWARIIHAASRVGGGYGGKGYGGVEWARILTARLVPLLGLREGRGRRRRMHVFDVQPNFGKVSMERRNA